MKSGTQGSFCLFAPPNSACNFYFMIQDSCLSSSHHICFLASRKVKSLKIWVPLPYKDTYWSCSWRLGLHIITYHLVTWKLLAAREAEKCGFYPDSLVPGWKLENLSLRKQEGINNYKEQQIVPTVVGKNTNKWINCGNRWLSDYIEQRLWMWICRKMWADRWAYSAQFIKDIMNSIGNFNLIRLATRTHCRPWRTEGVFSSVTELSFLITKNSCWWEIILIALCRMKELRIEGQLIRDSCFNSSTQDLL